MSEQIRYVGEAAARKIITNSIEKFSPISHEHLKSDITDLIIDSELSSTSTNLITNKAVATSLEEHKDYVDTEISNLASNVAYIDENDNETIELSVDLTTLASLVGGDV